MKLSILSGDFGRIESIEVLSIFEYSPRRWASFSFVRNDATGFLKVLTLERSNYFSPLSVHLLFSRIRSSLEFAFVSLYNGRVKNRPDG